MGIGKRLFNDAQKEEISKTVALAEKNTSGEIVPMVLHQSHDYIDVQWRLGVLCAFLSGFIALDFNLNWPLESYLWLQIPSLILGYFLGAIPWVKRFFLAKAQMKEQVHEQALKSFYKTGLSGTRDRTGILILISLLEHRVEILADVGISSQLEPKIWETMVNRLIQRIKSKELTEGLCEAITECGRLLSEKFPRKEDDTDELPNKVVTPD